MLYPPPISQCACAHGPSTDDASPRRGPSAHDASLRGAPTCKGLKVALRALRLVKLVL